MNKKIFNFKKIDAFATNKSPGNPAGTVCLESKEDITSNKLHFLLKFNRVLNKN